MIYRIVNIYGKVEYAYNLDINCSVKNYDSYNLDDPKAIFYIDQLEEIDPRVRHQKILETYECLNYMLYECEKEVKDIVDYNDSEEELIEKYLKYPLSIFYDLDALCNPKVIKTVVKEYPYLLYTFTKYDYRKYISEGELASLLILNQIYPYAWIDFYSPDTLRRKLFKNMHYFINFIVNYYNSGKTKNYIIPPEYSEHYCHIEDFVYYIPIDSSALKRIADRVIDFPLFYMDVKNSKYLTNEDYEYLTQMNIEYYNEKNKRMEEDKAKLQEEYAVVDDFSTYYHNLAEGIAKIVPKEFLNDREFINYCIERGEYATRYSDLYKDDIELIFKEVKYKARSIVSLSKDILMDKDFVLSVREVYEDILLSVDESILNDSEFMFEYLKRYSADEHLIIGEELSKDSDFFLQAYYLDSNIIRFASLKLRNNPKFMTHMIVINQRNQIYIGPQLKDDEEFMKKRVEKNKF